MSEKINDIENNLTEGFNVDELIRIILRRQNFLIKVILIIFLGSLTTLLFRRVYFPIFRGDFSLLITDPTTRNSNNKLSSMATGMMFEDLALNRTKNDIPTLIEVLRSPLVLSPVSQKNGITFKDLKSRILIEVGGGKLIREKANGVLNIYVTGKNKKKTLKILDDLSKAYLSTALKIRQQNLTDGLKFLNKQAPALEEKTTLIQNQLAEFRQENKLLEPQLEGKALKMFLDKVDQQIITLNSDRQKLLKVREEIVNGYLTTRGFKISIMSGSGDLSINNPQNQGLSISDSDQSLLQELEKLELQLASSKTIFKDDSKIISGLKDKINQIKPELREKQIKAVDAALNLNSDQLKTANKQREELNLKFTVQPKLIKEYNKLLQDLTLAKQNLSGLISARENFQLDMAQQSVPWRIISPPNMDQKPLRPHIPRNIAFGAIFSLVIGLIASALKDRMDHVFHSPAEVAQDLKTPTLGHMPFVEQFKGVRKDEVNLLNQISSEFQKKNNKKDSYERFFYQEALRNLFTSIKFLSSDNQIKVITLTSSVPAEGKSLMNILLSKSIADLGKRVLLVDADLRKSQIHKRLKINNLIGLSNYLSDNSLDIGKIIQRVPGYDNWSVITAGQSVPDSNRLLSSNRMKDLVLKLRENKNFDYILFDTTPLIGLADALLVSQFTDGVILLVSVNGVDRSLPLASMERIKSSKVLFLGTLTNSLKEQKNNSFGYGNYGSYGYGKYNAYSYSPYSYYKPEEKNKEIKYKENKEDKNQSIKSFKLFIINKYKKIIDWLDK